MPLPPQPLNSEQRQRICALLALGATRRLAARSAGFRRLDLEAELQRDPEFKRQVQQHELRPEIETLHALLAAARDPKQWRASAWSLERLYPRRYGRRSANAVLAADVRGLLADLEKQLRSGKLDANELRMTIKLLGGKKSRRKKRQKRSDPAEG